MLTIPKPLMSKLTAPALTGRVMAATLCGLGALTLTPALALADDDQASFWTQFTPSTDTRLVFVSSSEGNDNNNGLSPTAPVKSLDRAYDLLRDGQPDWMLLKRGDVWYESFPRWGKSGRDVDEKLVVGAYGESSTRPQIRPEGGSSGISGLGNDTVNHVAFVGFHLEPDNRAADEGGTGIRWLKDAEDILFEDLYIDGFKDNLALQAFGDGVTLRDFRINGCVVVDAWSNGGHSQGLYASGVDGLIVENSVFDHNGWNLDMGAEPTIFNHNAYIQSSNSNVVAKNNIFSDASATGIQMRSGGLLINNLFISNPVAFTLGSPSGYTMDYGVAVAARDNVVLYGRDLSASTPRAVGGYVSNISECDIQGNIFAHSPVGYNGQSLLIHGSENGAGSASINVSSNYFVGWRGTLVVDEESEPGTYGHISIQTNTFIHDMTNNNGRHVFDKPFVSLFSSDDPRVTVAGNRHFHYGMHDKAFRDNGNYVDIEYWRSHVDSEATFNSVSAMPDTLDIEDYLADNGVPGDLASFIAQCRSFSRSQSLGWARPSVVYDWYLENVDIFTSQ